MVSDEVKRAYVERTKAANYQASLRLEGFKNTDLPVAKSKQEIIDKYMNHNASCRQNGR